MKVYIFMLLISVQSLTYAHMNVGIYDLDVNISGNAYRDILRIDKIKENGDISGSFAVPKVFDVPISGKVIADKVKLFFIAKERGQEFRVDLEGIFKSKCSIKGRLIQKSTTFASFVGVRRGCHE